MPITYERAYGGFDQQDPDTEKHVIDFRNPVGTGAAIRKRNLIGKVAPNIEAPGQKMGKRWPAGFGALASYWSPRKEFGGTYDKNWEDRCKPLLPEDYDPRFLLCSPLDQQVPGYLTGGNRFILTNLTSNGYLRVDIPTMSFHFDTFFGSQQKRHDSKLVSVVIDSEGPRLVLVWQSSLQCGNDGEYLDVTVIRENGQLQ